MSWFNTSLNSIKGQITTFAQEVLAENATEEEEQNPAELLLVSQQKNEELTSLCATKDSEVNELLKMFKGRPGRQLSNSCSEWEVLLDVSSILPDALY